MNSIFRRSALLALPLILGCATARAATVTVDPAAQPAADIVRSLQQAVPRLQPGDTLLLADGVYRETLDLRLLPKRTRAGRIAIVAAPGAHPIIKGSDVVTGWQRVNGDVYAKTNWRANSQQVFVNGRPLQQIGGVLFGNFPHNPKHPLANAHRSQGGIWPGRMGNSRADMIEESFYYDSDSSTLYIRSTSMGGKPTIEVSTRPYLVIGEGIDEVDIRGLTFAHANTTAHGQSGAISLLGNHLLLQDVTITHVDGPGIDVTGNDNRIVNSSANYCGTVGMKVRGRNARLIGNETNFNNTRGFNKWWEAGGAKFVGNGGLQDSEVAGHRAYGNNGDGLWFDWRNDNNNIHDNVVAYNNGMGIHYEASSRAQLRGNYVVGNKQRGIYLPNASRSQLERNLIAANALEGVAIVDERGAATKGPEDFIPKDNRVTGNVIAWNGRAALILPADSNAASDGNVFIGAEPPQFSLGWASRERPLMTLNDWRARSRQDATSYSQAMPPPPALASQLAAQESFSTMHAEWRRILHALPNTARATPLQVSASLDNLKRTLESSP